MLLTNLLLSSLLLTHHGNGPYDWHITCDAWETRRIEIMLDPKLPRDAKMRLLQYLRSKLEKPCANLV